MQSFGGVPITYVGLFPVWYLGLAFRSVTQAATTPPPPPPLVFLLASISCMHGQNHSIEITRPFS